MSAVLFSGGLDSAVLLALERRDHERVVPIHVRAGLAWEGEERRAIDRLLAHDAFRGRFEPLHSLSLEMRDVYPATHWAVTGQPPAYDTPDEDVYLEGRNIVLIAKAAVLCCRLGIGRLALGPLAGNPFPDATPAFFESMSRSVSLGLARSLSIATPLAHLHKEDVVRLGATLGVPLALTLSCMNPADGKHCGRCSKCRERHDGFFAAGIEDPTDYLSRGSGVPGFRGSGGSGSGSRAGSGPGAGSGADMRSDSVRDVGTPGTPELRNPGTT